MSVTISVATSKDSYIDDNTPSRLILSTPEDWAEVYALRAKADAIVIGANTLRGDNPRLTLKSDALHAKRVAEGREPEPHKVIISGTGEISPSLRIFSGQSGNIIIFSQIARPELEGLAEVIICSNISAAAIVSTLEKRGLHNILVEGGAQILDMFFNSQCVDALRLAINPTIVVDDSSAPRLHLPEWVATHSFEQRNLGGMEVREYRLRPERHEDELLLNRAIEISRNCRPSQSSYCVGAVVKCTSGELFEGYTHETSPTHHAEQEAIKKAVAAGANLTGATIYSSMEPCSKRSSEKKSCSEIIMEMGFKRAIFALYEPSCFVECTGALNMRLHGIEVLCINSLAQKVRDVNSHLNF